MSQIKRLSDVIKSKNENKVKKIDKSISEPNYEKAVSKEEILPRKKYEKGKMKPKEYCIYLLSKREYSIKEIRNKLKAREHSEDEINETIEWLQENKFQSDEDYASMRVRSKKATLGNMRLKYELSLKGISEDIIKQQLAELPSEENRVYAILKQKNISKNMEIKEKQKIYRQLAGKGFSFDNINKAWNKILKK